MPTKHKYAVIDTESSGIFDFAKPADAEGQPRLASLGLILFDSEFNRTFEGEYLVKPDGWVMHPEATKVNGLTTEYLLEHGMALGSVLKLYTTLVEQGYVVAAYNAQFDTKVMRGELRRAGLPDLFEVTPNVCLMRACTNVCKVPKKVGPGWKFPKLSEACAFFKIVQTDEHSALGDTRAAANILIALAKLGLLPVPEVHFAKTQPSTPSL